LEPNVYRPRALVIGGSLAGLFAANLLRTIGWDVAVFERSRGDLSDRGAGLGAQPELFAVMRHIGIRLDDSIGVEVSSRICLDRTGNILCEVPLREVGTAWDRIYRALKHALPAECCRTGMIFERLEQDEQKVTAVFADGSRDAGDLLVGADGVHSAVRRQLVPELKPRYAGYVARRGVVQETDVPRPLHDLLLCHMTFCFPPNAMVLSMPVAASADSHRHGRRCQYVWCRPVDHEWTLSQMCTDATGRHHGDSIAPNLIRRELLSELKATAKASMAPQIAWLVAHAAQPILSPIFDLQSPQIVFGRVALMGDAAFVARPHVGTGVTKAALDAKCLAEALAASNGDLVAGLKCYDSDRQRFGNWLVARGRRIGDHVEAQLRQDKPHDCGGLDPRHQVIMRELGAGGVIDGEAISAHCG
jgi:2-polyprenyl-6-methoxyphenol hydroxylase-like FAD-dependent oxidoreductase